MKSIQSILVILFSVFMGCFSGSSYISIETENRNILDGKSIALMGSYYFIPTEESNKFNDMDWDLAPFESKTFSNQMILNYSDRDFISFDKTFSVLNEKDLRDTTKTIKDVLIDYGFGIIKTKFKGNFSQPRGQIFINSATIKTLDYISKNINADAYAYVLYFPVIHSVSSGSIVATTKFHISVVGTIIVLDKSGKQLFVNSIYLKSHEGHDAGIFGSEKRGKKLNTMISYNFKPIMCEMIYHQLVQSFGTQNIEDYNELIINDNPPPFILPIRNGEYIYIYWNPKSKTSTYSLNLMDKDNILKSFSWVPRSPFASGYFELGDVWTDLNLNDANLKFQIIDEVGNKTPTYSINKNTWK